MNSNYFDGVRKKHKTATRFKETNFIDKLKSFVLTKNLN